MAAQFEDAVVDRVAVDLSSFSAICVHHGGKVVTDRGDGLKMVFESAVEAFRAGMEMQKLARTRTSAEAPGGPQIRHRMGLHFGDVMLVESPSGDDVKVTGHDVNIAARLQEECTPGQICLSNEVYQLVHGRVEVPLRYIGAIEVKNLPNRVRCWSTGWEDSHQARPHTSDRDQEIMRRAVRAARAEIEAEAARRHPSWVPAALAITGFAALMTALVWPYLAPKTPDHHVVSRVAGPTRSDSPAPRPEALRQTFDHDTGADRATMGTAPSKSETRQFPAPGTGDRRQPQDKPVDPEEVKHRLLVSIRSDLRLFDYPAAIAKVKKLEPNTVASDMETTLNSLQTGFEEFSSLLRKTNDQDVKVSPLPLQCDMVCGTEQGGKIIRMLRSGDPSVRKFSYDLWELSAESRMALADALLSAYKDDPAAKDGLVKDWASDPFGGLSESASEETDQGSAPPG
jgi:class 3 adenylate cyclase